MGKTHVRIEGMDEVQKAMQQAARRMEHQNIEPILRNGAEVMAQAARSAVPRGPTGNLASAIIVKRQGNDDPPVYLAAVDRRRAPHAHLVEFGTGPRYHATTGKYVGHMPPQPFWRPSWDSVRGIIEGMLRNGIAQRVKRG